MSAPPKVAVPHDLFGALPMSGRGRMWHEVLRRLQGPFNLVPVGEGERRTVRPPRAWLYDGHEGPMPVRQPQVIQLHEAPWREPETMATLEPHFVTKVVEPSRRAARGAAAIVCPSESARRQIVADCEVPAEVVFVAHHGVDHAVFHAGVTGGAELVTRYGAEPGRPYVLCVASVHPRKNLGTLRDAFGYLRHRPHHLVLVGGPAYGRNDGAALLAAALAARPDDPGRVVSVPHGIDDGQLAALMCGAAAFCLPSLSEGFGLPAAEAMACGVPTVLADRGALPEIGGDAAVLVEPDAESIAAGLDQVLGDAEVAAKLGEACARQAAGFTWDRCAERWGDALRFGLAGGR